MTRTRATERAYGVEYPRLSPADLMFLRLESPAWPCHFGGLAILGGAGLVDESGRFRLDEVTERLAPRVMRVPELRSRLHVPGWLSGPPLWVEDDRFALAHHLHKVVVPAPGDEEALLATAARVQERLIERDGPLWELWFLTGLVDGRVGMLLKLHHAVADGLGAVALMGSLFDPSPDVRPSPHQASVPLPTERMLFLDNVRCRLRALRIAVISLFHPREIARGLGVFARMTRGFFGRAAPDCSLNRPVGPGRAVRALSFDLAAMKDVADAGGGRVNDVVLALWAGGLRELLTSRHESLGGRDLIAGMPVSLRSLGDGTIGNQAGMMVFPLPVWEEDVRLRLGEIAHRTARAKREQIPTAIMSYVAGLAATPIGKYYVAHQRANNTLVSNLAGPAEPLRMLGAPVLEILPIMQLTGNIGLELCAFSYSGRMFLVVTADAGAFPDIDVAIRAMEADWLALAGAAMPAAD